ncbi:hypothetical protein AB834_01100 [PVC group bacterium (ex Bugula neritina AB1)]|nr:hypothetical protein AB834_01100 [PVC group bacterium (ex Bugula neritina AB1)]
MIILKLVILTLFFIGIFPINPISSLSLQSNLAPHFKTTISDPSETKLSCLLKKKHAPSQEKYLSLKDICFNSLYISLDPYLNSLYISLFPLALAWSTLDSYELEVYGSFEEAYSSFLLSYLEKKKPPSWDTLTKIWGRHFLFYESLSDYNDSLETLKKPIGFQKVKKVRFANLPYQSIFKSLKPIIGVWSLKKEKVKELAKHLTNEFYKKKVLALFPDTKVGTDKSIDRVMTGFIKNICRYSEATEHLFIKTCLIKPYAEISVLPTLSQTPSNSESDRFLQKKFLPPSTVTPSSSEATELSSTVTPSSSDATEPSSTVTPSSSDATELSSTVTPSSSDATEPSSTVTPSSSDATELSSTVTPSSSDATEPSSTVTPSSSDATELSSTPPSKPLKKASLKKFFKKHYIAAIFFICQIVITISIIFFFYTHTWENNRFFILFLKIGLVTNASLFIISAIASAIHYCRSLKKFSLKKAHISTVLKSLISCLSIGFTIANIVFLTISFSYICDKSNFVYHIFLNISLLILAVCFFVLQFYFFKKFLKKHRSSRLEPSIPLEITDITTPIGTFEKRLEPSIPLEITDITTPIGTFESWYFYLLSKKILEVQRKSVYESLSKQHIETSLYIHTLIILLRLFLGPEVNWVDIQENLREDLLNIESNPSETQETRNDLFSDLYKKTFPLKEPQIKSLKRFSESSADSLKKQVKDSLTFIIDSFKKINNTFPSSAENFLDSPDFLMDIEREIRDVFSDFPDVFLETTASDIPSSSEETASTMHPSAFSPSHPTKKSLPELNDLNPKKQNATSAQSTLNRTQDSPLTSKTNLNDHSLSTSIDVFSDFPGLFLETTASDISSSPEETASTMHPSAFSPSHPTKKSLPELNDLNPKKQNATSAQSTLNRTQDSPLTSKTNLNDHSLSTSIEEQTILFPYSPEDLATLEDVIQEFAFDNFLNEIFKNLGSEDFIPLILNRLFLYSYQHLREEKMIPHHQKKALTTKESLKNLEGIFKKVWDFTVPDSDLFLENWENLIHIIEEILNSRSATTEEKFIKALEPFQENWQNFATINRFLLLPFDAITICDTLRKLVEDLLPKSNDA